MLNEFDGDERGLILWNFCSFPGFLPHSDSLAEFHYISFFLISLLFKFYLSF